MKKLFAITAMVLCFGLFVSCAEANPFLSCDPQAGVTKYKVNMPSAGIVDEITNAQANGSALHDISSWPSGTYNDGEIRAGAEYILNGVPQNVWRWSDPTPFDITVPALPAGALNLTVIP